MKERHEIMDNNKKIERIRAQYTEKQVSELDTLIRLDAKVKRPANMFAYIFGSIGAVVMGCGMSLIMTDIGSVVGIGNTMTVGITVGICGMAMALINYPIYKGILSSRKKKYAPEIIELSDKMIDKE